MSRPSSHRRARRFAARRHDERTRPPVNPPDVVREYQERHARDLAPETELERWARDGAR